MPSELQLHLKMGDRIIERELSLRVANSIPELSSLKYKNEAFIVLQTEPSLSQRAGV